MERIAKRVLTLITLICITNSCAYQQYPNLSRMSGTISGGRYYSPRNNYSIEFSPSPFNSIVEDRCVGNYSCVSFNDDFGDLTKLEIIENYRDVIASLQLPSLPEEELLEYLFEEVILNNVSNTHDPKIIFKDEKRLVDIGEVKFYILCIPEGSTLMNAQTKIRPESLRPYLLSFDDENLVIISKQESPIITNIRNELNQEINSGLYFENLIEIRRDYRRENPIVESLSFK